MIQAKVGGCLREEPNSKHWLFEERLKPLLASRVGGSPLDLGDVDLRPYTSPRHDQRKTGSCVAQSVVKAIEIKRIMKYGREAHVDLSVMALYYLARELMCPPKTHRDGGTYVSCAMDALRRFGVCAEDEWPFEEWRLTKAPSWMAMRRAYRHKIGSFYQITSTGYERVEDVVLSLHAGNPVVFGARIGKEWFGYDGSFPLEPSRNPTGGHATVLVGYVDGLLIGENSWGESFGLDGFYTATPEFVADITAYDFWVLQAGFEGS